MKFMKAAAMGRGFWMAACCGALLLAGCEGQQSTALKSSGEAYRAGDYASSYREARRVADLPTEPKATRESAAYMAGLAAYRNKDSMAAQQYLQMAAASSDRRLAADAKASLGLVYADRGLYRMAAESLQDAANLMSGQDKANAYFYAGVAQQKDGRWPQARTTLSLAMSNSRDPVFRQRVADQLRVTGYTLQTGAFDVESNAQNAARALVPKAAALKISSPRVMPALDPVTNRRRFLVWVGQFSSWPTALMARENLGTTNAVVTPLTEPTK